MKACFFPTYRVRSAAGRLVLLVLTAVGVAPQAVRAQQTSPKTSDINFQVAADGSMNMAFQMTFDAPNWRAWKAMVGEEPARMRAQMRHRFAVMTLEDFKLERDDMNRVAKMSMHSPSGPELREDGTFQMPVDGYFRLVNHAGQEWFFSGNNPQAGGTLNNVKVTLPAQVTEAHVINADNPDQALVYSLAAAPSPGRWFYLAGGLVVLLGLALMLFGLLGRRRRELALPAGQTPLLARAATPPPFSPPPAKPPVFTPRSASGAPASVVSAPVPEPTSEPAAADDPAASVPVTPPQPEASPLPAALPPPFQRPTSPPPFQPRDGSAEHG